MNLTFTESAWQDYLWFQEHNRQVLKRLNDLIRDAQRSPFRGLGKPEPLKGELSGYWSRRITEEHRYLIVGQSRQGRLLIVSYTERGDVTRLISAKEVSSVERKAYEEG